MCTTFDSLGTGIQLESALRVPHEDASSDSIERAANLSVLHYLGAPQPSSRWDTVTCGGHSRRRQYRKRNLEPRQSFSLTMILFCQLGEHFKRQKPWTAGHARTPATILWGRHTGHLPHAERPDP